MVKQRTIVTDDTMVTVCLDEETQNKIVDAVIDFYTKHDCWSGESIMQMDAPQINAAPFLANMVDTIIRPTVEYKTDHAL